MKSNGWVLGYHGCDAELGESILQGSYPGAGFQERTHVQLAVRKESSIIAYFRPRFARP